jgi:hypothetical protein
VTIKLDIHLELTNTSVRPGKSLPGATVMYSVVLAGADQVIIEKVVVPDLHLEGPVGASKRFDSKSPAAAEQRRHIVRRVGVVLNVVRLQAGAIVRNHGVRVRRREALL